MLVVNNQIKESITSFSLPIIFVKGNFFDQLNYLISKIIKKKLIQKAIKVIL